MYYLRLITILLSLAMVQGVAYAQQSWMRWAMNKPLQWADFKGTVDAASELDAMSFTGVSYKFRAEFKKGKPVLTFETFSYFDPDKSWSKADKQLPAALRHQQSYFNINEYFSRQLKKSFDSYPYTSNYKQEIMRLYEQNVAQRNVMFSKFYLATGFADDEAVNEKWISYIENLLLNDCTIAQAIQNEPVIDFQNTAKHKLWNAQEPLKWDDFKGPVDENSEFWAVTHSGISLTGKLNESNGQYQLVFKTTGYQSIQRSWTKPTLQSAGLLMHEQMHFNISEFYARQLGKILNGYHYTSNYMKEVIALRAQVMQQLRMMHARYDNDTQHRKNSRMQSAWEAYIANLLSHDYTLQEALNKMPGVG
jgi:hypothetical protein